MLPSAANLTSTAAEFLMFQQTTMATLEEAVGAEGAEDELACEIGSIPFLPDSEWLFAGVASFQQVYGQIHPYIAAVLCVIGTLMNLVTVVVLTRPSMISPVNVLLCAVACCDIVVMSSYFVFVMHFMLAAGARCLSSDYSYGWALFTMFHAHASVIFHAASIWMTVSLAQIRVLTIRRATAGPGTSFITERFTAVLALVTCALMALVNMPNFLTFEITGVPSNVMLPCLQTSVEPLPIAEAVFAPTPNSIIIAQRGEEEGEEPKFELPISVTTPPLEGQKKAGRSLPEGAVTVVGDAAISEAAPKKESVLSPSSTPPNPTDEKPFIKNGASLKKRKRHKREDNFNGNQNEETSSDPVPILVGSTLSHSSDGGEEEELVYTVRANDKDCKKLRLAFWSNGMIFKVVPCLMLTLSIVFLLKIISEVGQKRKNLAQVMRKKVPKDHTTPMLAAILSIFLVAELPQGIMLVFTGIFSNDTFHKKIYLPLGDFMDLLSLLNSAIGFLIYILMSRKFRTVFLQLVFSAIRVVFNEPESPECKASQHGCGSDEERGRGKRFPPVSGIGAEPLTAAVLFSSHFSHAAASGAECPEKKGGFWRRAKSQQKQQFRNRGGWNREHGKRGCGCCSGNCTGGLFRRGVASRLIARYEQKRLNRHRPQSGLATRTERIQSTTSAVGAPTMLMASCAAAMTAAATTVGPQLLGLSSSFSVEDFAKRLSLCSLNGASTRRSTSRELLPQSPSSNFLPVPSPHQEYGLHPLRRTTEASTSPCSRDPSPKPSEALMPEPHQIQQQQSSSDGGVPAWRGEEPSTAENNHLPPPPKRISFNIPSEEDGGVEPSMSSTPRTTNTVFSMWWRRTSLLQGLSQRFKSIKY